MHRPGALHGFSTWWSGAARFTPYLLLAIAVFAPAALAVSIGFSNVYAREYPKNNVATPLRVIQSGITLIITLLHAAIDSSLFCSALLHPVYAVCSAALFFTGWVAQTSFWMACYKGGTFEPSCPEHWLIYPYYHTRAFFAPLITALYLVYLVFAAMATHRWRRQRREKFYTSSIATDSAAVAAV